MFVSLSFFTIYIVWVWIQLKPTFCVLRFNFFFFFLFFPAGVTALGDNNTIEHY